MSRTHGWLSSVLIILLFMGRPASADNPPPPASLDTWVDFCEVMATDAKLGSVLGDAECALILAQSVVQRDPTTYDILVEPRTLQRSGLFPNPMPFCTDSKFFGEDRAIGPYPGRTGILVGPDLVLTAAHGIAPTATAVPWVIVFGFNGRPIIQGQSGCFYNHTVGLHADNVYQAVQVVAHGSNVYPGHDLLLLRLDRPVVNRKPVRIRRAGQAEVGDRLVCIGHPDQLPTKVDLWGRFEGLSTDRRELSVSGIHAFTGSSGSMIYNRQRDYVEGLVAFGGASFDTTAPEGCIRTIHTDGAGRIGPTMYGFAPFIPPFSLIVSPLDTVTHIGVVGGTVTNPTTDYNIALPPNTPEPLHVKIEVDPPWFKGSGLPRVEAALVPAFLGVHQGIVPTALRVDASIAGVPKGEYLTTVKVHDLEAGFVDTLLHRFEVGATNFSVKPASGFEGLQMAPPIQSFKQYELSNLTPTPLVVEVRTSVDWITINGVEAPTGGTLVRQIPLGPAETRSGTATVTLGISRRIETAPPATFQSTVTLDNLDNSPVGHGDTSIPVTFQWGTQAYKSAPGTNTPVPDDSPTGVVVPLNVGDSFCVDQVWITVGPFGVARTSDLQITLMAPNGTAVVVWDRQSFHGNEEAATFSTPAMQAFNGLPALGNWSLRIADVVAGGPQVYFGDWALIGRSRGAPPCQ